MKRALPIFSVLTALLVTPPALAQTDTHRQGPFGILRFDSNQDGQLTRQEFTQALNNQFAAMDANNDGQSTPEERAALREQRTEAGASERFARLDADGDGQVSEEEFAELRRERGAPDASSARRRGPRMGARNETITFEDFSERQLARFANLDANDDDVVTQAELHSAPGRRHKG